MNIQRVSDDRTNPLQTGLVNPAQTNQNNVAHTQNTMNRMRPQDTYTPTGNGGQREAALQNPLTETNATTERINALQPEQNPLAQTATPARENPEPTAPEPENNTRRITENRNQQQQQQQEIVRAAGQREPNRNRMLDMIA